jgi:hypothetical protein
VIDQLKAAVEDLRARRNRELARSARACFCDPVTGEISRDGKRLLADLARAAKLGGTAVTRDNSGRVDPLALAVVEGRRELLNRLINLLGVEPASVPQIAEVDDGRA